MNKCSKIIIFLILINVIIFVYMIIKLNHKKQENEKLLEFPYEEGVFPSQEEIEEANKGLVYLQNMDEISNVYTDSKPMTYIAVKIEDIINNIFNTAITSMDDINTFFNENKDKIEERLNIEKFEDFKILINKITTDSNISIIKAEISNDSAKEDNRILNADLKLTLSNQEEIILNLEIDEQSTQIYIS